MCSTIQFIIFVFAVKTIITFLHYEVYKKYPGAVIYIIVNLIWYVLNICILYYGVRKINRLNFKKISILVNYSTMVSLILGIWGYTIIYDESLQKDTFYSNRYSKQNE